MPVNWSCYPEDWPRVVAAVRERSRDRCECRGICGEQHSAAVSVGRCVRINGAEEAGARRTYRIVLTTAHTCSCSPLCGDLAHLLHLCQPCHLRLDARQHAENARRTRAEKRDAANGNLFE